MNHRVISLACCVVLCIVYMTGCSSNQIKQVEVTRIVRETVVVPQAAPTAAIAPAQIQAPEPVDETIFSVENNEIRILVTEYYVLLDHGLYEEAFNLLDPSIQQNRSLEEYVEGSSVIYDQVKLLRLEAYDEYTERAGLEKLNPPEDVNFVHVNLMAFHKGAKPDEGVMQQLFIELKKTSNEWRIHDFATSPPVQDDFTGIDPAPTATSVQTQEPVDDTILSVENNEIRNLVSEYYVLIDHGLYEEAFKLLDPSFQQKYRLEQFIEGQSAFYDEIALMRVEAYDEFTERGDLEKFIPPKDIRYVFVDLITWPKGSKPNDGMPQQMFVQLKQTDNEWRISNFWTSPPTR